jgi:hypothetical protein
VEPDGHGAPEWGTSALDRTYGTSWIPVGTVTDQRASSPRL